MEAKELIRNQMRLQRKQLTVEDIKHVSKTIARGLREVVDWSQVANLHTYQAIAKSREIETYSFLQWLTKQHPSINVDLQDFGGNFPETKYDVILVPGLAFDRKGNRIGYGKGHYDKFLAGQDKAVKIGISYEFAVLDRIPVESHDITLNYIISEEELYN